MTNPLQEMSNDELLDILRGREIVGFVGRVSGSDDMGFVSDAYPVTADGLIKEGPKLARPDGGASPIGDVYAHVLTMIGNIFHQTYPQYGSGRDCADSFMMTLPPSGHTLGICLGSYDLSEDAGEILRQASSPVFMRP